MWRDLHPRAASPEAFFDAAHIRALMSAAAPERPDSTAPPRADLAPAALLAGSTPLAAALGCWLQGMSAPGVFESPGQLTLLALLADDIGVGAPETSRYDAFRQALRHAGLTGHAVPADQVAALRDLPDTLFALPAVLLAMSRRSDGFAPELVGVDHALRTIGLIPPWRALRDRLPSATHWERLDLAVGSGRAGIDDPLAASAEVRDLTRSLGEDTAERVDAGADWLRRALRVWEEALAAFAERASDPELAMLDLVRARAREAAVYHHDFTLGERSLAELFAVARTDPAPLVSALAASKLVRPGDSGRSPLVNGMVGPRGPMFRVFGRDDLAVLRRWIDHLPVRHDRPAPTVPALPAPPPAAATDPGADPGDRLREAYHLLQGRALPPRTREFAVDYVERWLDLSRRSLDRTDRCLPRHWRPGSLRAWLLDQHDRHDEQFTDTDADSMPSRDDVIDSTVQLAPLTLIDGAWLQGFTDVRLASSRVGFPLFETYWDELGNGDPALNHPLIYRRVLRGMGVELPPTGSREFADDPRFREESFRLPVYWLCLGKLPVTYLPEILGMNLAMELSGVGGSYRSAQRFLRHHGFDTRFVDIHNTIDNVATGHSAWAADAIDTHLREHPDDRAERWTRVRVGYESLAPLTTRRGAWLPARRRRAHPAPALHHIRIGAVS